MLFWSEQFGGKSLPVSLSTSISSFSWFCFLLVLLFIFLSNKIRLSRCWSFQALPVNSVWRMRLLSLTLPLSGHSSDCFLIQLSDNSLVSLPHWLPDSRALFIQAGGLQRGSDCFFDTSLPPLPSLRLWALQLPAALLRLQISNYHLFGHHLLFNCF